MSDKTKKPAKALVLAALRKAKTPLSAYAILDALAPNGIKSPPIVYRALAALAAEGQAHPVRQLSAYVACSGKGGHEGHPAVIAVCQQCSGVEELPKDKLREPLQKLAAQAKVELAAHSVVELPVTCRDCQ